MNHYYAAEIATEDGKPTGTYRYVSANNGRVAASKYCAMDPQNNGDLCPGHDTKEGAYEHAKQHDLDHMRLVAEREDARTKHKCEAKDGCEAFTSGAAYIGGYRVLHLCNEHRNREEAAKLYEVHESWES